MVGNVNGEVEKKRENEKSRKGREESLMFEVETQGRSFWHNL